MDGRGRKHGTLAMRDALPRVAGIVPLAVRRTVRERVRHGKAMLDGRVAAPKRAATVLTLGVLGSFGAYGAVVSGQIGAWTDEGLAGAGLAIRDIRVEGAVETSSEDIMRAVGVPDTVSVAGVSSKMARERLVALPWVADAALAKEYPNTLVVTLTERTAAARWRVGPRTLLVDDAGRPIAESDGRSLPLLVGEGADGAVDNGLALLAAAPEMARQFKALVRIGSRRWDAVTHRNVTVQLPADGALDALDRLAMLQATEQLLDKDLVSIDLRVPDRVALRLTTEAAEARAERVAAAAKERNTTRKDREVAL